MPYKFTYDPSKVPLFFFTEIVKISYQKGIHKSLLKTLNSLILKFKIQEIAGLNLSDSLVLLPFKQKKPLLVTVCQLCTKLRKRELKKSTFFKEVE
jgi:hypothetical protein